MVKGLTCHRVQNVRVADQQATIEDLVHSSSVTACGSTAAWKLCESRGGRPGLPVPNSTFGLCGRKATLKNRAQELCESRGGRPGLPVPNSPYGVCGRKATLNLKLEACGGACGWVVGLIRPRAGMRGSNRRWWWWWWCWQFVEGDYVHFCNTFSVLNALAARTTT